MRSVSALSPWKKYKRFSDGITVSAHLVERTTLEGKTEKMIEVKETRVGDFKCPHCDGLITQGDTGSFPNFFFEPAIFHSKHRPIDSA